MGKIALQLKATLENVTNLRPVGEDFRWYLKMKCGNCGEISEKWQYIRLMDSVALKGGRGSASMVQKCKLCARENSIEILSNTIKSYNDSYAQREERQNSASHPGRLTQESLSAESMSTEYPVWSSATAGFFQKGMTWSWLPL
ncbi:CXXC motif containing zinc binding protein isoform X2 [Nannospalax galili]|uniref:CXXC motif containing zinc binding protein isoform X2 n=1 Tax=Nannospalax galili TaxID=1026970 RepID=UPI000819C2BF|nr:CXXC motif containing zinc binding protein isoform X2 [Nannospalax galili]